MNGTKHSSIGCPSCGSRETVRVTMTLGGVPTTFTSCSYCDWRGWEREGRSLTLTSVLTLVSAS